MLIVFCVSSLQLISRIELKETNWGSNFGEEGWGSSGHHMIWSVYHLFSLIRLLCGAQHSWNTWTCTEQRGLYLFGYVVAAGSLGLFGPERRCSAVLVCQSVLLDVSGGASGSATDSSVINDLVAKVLVPVLQVTARGAGIEPKILGFF